MVPTCAHFLNYALDAAVVSNNLLHAGQRKVVMLRDLRVRWRRGVGHQQLHQLGVRGLGGRVGTGMADHGHVVV